MQIRLQFYGIKYCEDVELKEVPLKSKKASSVTISYKSIPLYRANVTILNNI